MAAAEPAQALCGSFTDPPHCCLQGDAPSAHLSADNIAAASTAVAAATLRVLLKHVAAPKSADLWHAVLQEVHSRLEAAEDATGGVEGGVLARLALPGISVAKKIHG